MRASIGLPLRVAAAVLAGWLATSAAKAIIVQLDSFSVDFAGGGEPPFFLEDPFDDGVISPSLFPFCGSLDDSDESDGLLTLRRPSTDCGGQQAASIAYADTGSVTVRGSFVFRVPELGESYGISVGDIDVLDFASVGLSQFDFPGQGRRINVFLADEFFPVTQNVVELLVIPGLPEDLEFTTVTFELTATRVSGVSDVLVPHGRVSFDGGPFQDLGEVVSPTTDGTLSSDGLHAGSFFNNTLPAPAAGAGGGSRG